MAHVLVIVSDFKSRLQYFCSFGRERHEHLNFSLGKIRMLQGQFGGVGTPPGGSLKYVVQQMKQYCSLFLLCFQLTEESYLTW